MIRLALIGSGAWGKNYIAAAKETGIAEVTHQFGRDWHERIQSSKYGSIDAFIIATPPEPRANICRNIAARGYPMMVEKPVCLSVREVESIERCMAPSIPFLVNYTHLFSPAYETLRSRVQESLGRVRVYGRTSSDVERSYSPLWDHGCHDLAMCLGLGLEKPVHVSAAKSEDGSHQDMDVHFDSGDAVHVRVSRGRKAKTLVVMCGSLGAVYDACAGVLEVDGKPAAVSTERPLTRAVRAFAEAVRDGGTDDWRFGIGSALEITRMLEQVHGGGT